MASILLLNTSIVHSERDSELDIWKQLAQEYHQQGEKNSAATYFIKIGYYYWEKHQNDSAANAFQQALKESMAIVNKNAINTLYSNLGLIYLATKKFNQSEECFKHSIKGYKEKEDIEDAMADLVNLAMTYSAMKRYHSTEENLLEALEIATQLESPKTLRTIFGLLADNYQKLGDSAMFSLYFDKYTALQRQLLEQELNLLVSREKIVSEEKIRKESELLNHSNNLENIQEIRKNQQFKTELDNKQKLLEEMLIRENELRIEKDNLRRWSFIGMVIFLGLIVILLFTGYRIKQKANQKLKKNNAKLLLKQEVIDSKTKKLTDSIVYAKRIQQALIPNQEHCIELFDDAFVIFKPRDIVSGDFFWYHIPTMQQAQKNWDELIFAVVDCTGHGIPGAFMSMIGLNQLTEIVNAGIHEPAKILGSLHMRVREALKQKESDNRDGMDMSIVRIDKKNMIMDFAGANNHLIYFNKKGYNEIKGNIFPVGGYFDGSSRSFEQHRVTLEHEATYYMFSDGYSDQLGGVNGRKFLARNFRYILGEIQGLNLKDQRNVLVNRHNEWKGSFQQVDDILVVGFKV